MPISLLELHLSISSETRNKKRWAKHQDRSANNIPLATDPAKLIRSDGKALDSRADNNVLFADKPTSKTVTISCVASPSPSPPDSSIPATAFTALSASTAVGEREENEIPEDLRAVDHGSLNTPVMQSRITMGRQRDQYKTRVREMIHHSVVHSDTEDLFRSFRYDAHPMAILTSAFAYPGT
ncbi:hypothetical protein FIBSPDRAFT_950547 [Athelia psychrophila]|uniref:Uncharacterized protein n=1 Tax=Athelia psychrophila TaxID=1759441 RepID=A0A166NMK8_9AGAM|nr:hypothetical protein FIBSPDRAFT_950547 [Fibularhizoctonia sp. CBS 109695]